MIKFQSSIEKLKEVILENPDNIIDVLTEHINDLDGLFNDMAKDIQAYSEELSILREGLDKLKRDRTSPSGVS